jgi:hypothetical protein
MGSYTHASNAVRNQAKVPRRFFTAWLDWWAV